MRKYIKFQSDDRFICEPNIDNEITECAEKCWLIIQNKILEVLTYSDDFVNHIINIIKK